ncbi:MAG: AMP-binding protein [Alphaproteobacteria bacterium]|nr:AMP-binding protein [Alphaproteobacteria bacterium]
MYSPNLGRLFSTVAKTYPDAASLVFEDQTIDYSALSDLVWDRAGRLAGLGVRQGDVVIIIGEKTVESFVLILACLLSGAPYVVADPDNPSERQRRILERCRPRLVFTGSPSAAAEALGAVAAGVGSAVLTAQALEAAPSAPFTPAPVTGSDPAYIMFTSGSTGFPKGAVMSHANVARLIDWSRNRFGFGPGEVLTNVNPLYFDNSVFDVYSSLFTGAALAPFTKAETLNPKALIDGIEARGCTSWFSVPSFLIYLDSLRALTPAAMPQLRRFIFGGEGYPLGRLKSLYDKFADRAAIVNVYGPTECTCICSAYVVGPADFEDLTGFPPLGALTPEFSGRIVGSDGTEIEPGETGELVLYGPCVGLGYYNDPKRTAAGFVGAPDGAPYELRGYRTGDLVSLSPEDGKLRIAGRRDHQVKHMGYRIELEEIENALCAIEGITQAAVLHGTRYGNSALAAVVTGEPGLDEDAVLTQLRARVPAYMMPARVHFRETLPKNANGKLDRGQLRAACFDTEECIGAGAADAQAVGR